MEAGAGIAVRDVSVLYGSVLAARDVTFDIAPGEFVSLIGPSGCGKSTVLRAIGGLLPTQSGEIVLRGRPVVGPMPRDVAFVFQDLALYPWRSARRNVEIAMELAGVPRAIRRRRALDVLGQVGLADVAERFPGQLSGGMQQRVAIARALVSEAPVLLLDEPFAALDEQTRLDLGGQLLGLLADRGKTVVFVTHSLAEAGYLSDRIVVMGPRPGTVVEVITVPMPRPRVPELMRSPEFHDLQDRLLTVLFQRSAHVPGPKTGPTP